MLKIFKKDLLVNDFDYYFSITNEYEDLKKSFLQLTILYPEQKKHLLVQKLKFNNVQYQIHASIFSDQDNNIYIFSAFYDMTNIEDIMSELSIKNDALVKDMHESKLANKSLTDLMENIIHDICNPLCAVIAAANFLKSEALYLNAENKELLDIVLEGAERVLEIKNEVGYHPCFGLKTESTIVSFNLYNELLSLINIFSIEIKKKGLSLRFHYNLHPLKNLFIGNLLILKRIIENLLSNSIKFTNVGSIELTTKLISINNNKAKISIAVKDTGIGIHSSKHKMMFNRYARVENPYNLKSNGYRSWLINCY